MPTGPDRNESTRCRRPPLQGRWCAASTSWQLRATVLEPECPGVRDALHQEVSGIFDGRQGPGVRAGRRPIARRGRGALKDLKELMRAVVVLLGAEAVERTLLGRQRRSGRPNRLRLERLVRPFMRALLLRRRGPAPRPVVANGTPLSVRIAFGRPYLRNSRSKTGRTPRQTLTRRVSRDSL